MSDLSDIPTKILEDELMKRLKTARRAELSKVLPAEIRYNGKILDFDTEVFLVQPSVHGGGGWCGSSTIAKGRLRHLICCDPQLEYGYCDGSFGDDRYRICIDENPNHSVAIYDSQEYKWKIR